MQLSIYELDDLADKVKAMTGGEPLGMLSFANRTGQLRELLAAIGLDGLLPSGVEATPKQIVVLGDTQVSVDKLRSIAKREGVESESIEFCLEYDKLKHYDFSKFRDKEVYRAVLFGPGPHSTPGKGNSSSAMEKMKGSSDTYPPVIEIRERGGALKITANSFKDAIRAALAC